MCVLREVCWQLWEVTLKGTVWDDTGHTAIAMPDGQHGKRSAGVLWEIQHTNTLGRHTKSLGHGAGNPRAKGTPREPIRGSQTNEACVQERSRKQVGIVAMSV